MKIGGACQGTACSSDKDVASAVSRNFNQMVQPMALVDLARATRAWLKKETGGDFEVILRPVNVSPA